MDAAVINAGTIAAARLDAEVVKSKLIDATFINAADIFAQNSITSASGIFGTMDASVINAGTIAAARLDAETVKAKLIDASLINAVDILAGNSITATNGIIGSLDAGVITAGTLSAARIGAKSITTDKLVITSTDNLIIEADFTNGGSSWGLGPAYKWIMPDRGRGGLPALRFVGTTSEIICFNQPNKFKTEAKNRFQAHISVRSTDPLAIGKVKLMLRCYPETGSPIDIVAVQNQAALTANTWTTLTGVCPELPSGTMFLEAFLSVTNPTDTTWTEVDFVSLTRASDATLIVDGSIVGTKIHGDAINGMTITGATIQTAATGARVVLDAGGLNAYDINGVNYLQAEDTGLTMVGTIVAKGETDEQNPRPMKALLGNYKIGNMPTYNQAGLHFIREDLDGTETWQPRIVSHLGEDIFIESAWPAGQTHSASYIHVEYDRIQLWSAGIDGVGMETGNAQMSVRDEFIYLSSLDYTIRDQQLGYDYKIEPDVLPQKAASGTERNDKFYNDPLPGASVVRTDIGGITQRYIDGQWSGFAGSVAYATIGGGYKNYGAGYPTAHGYMGPDGRSYLGGMIGITSTGSVTITGGIFYTICTLPASCRPPYTVIFKQAHSSWLPADTLVYVFPDGNVQYLVRTTLTLTNGANQFWISLEGISWRNSNC
jgi:hypothetical protein